MTTPEQIAQPSASKAEATSSAVFRHDFGRTLLGPVEAWPPSVRATSEVVLANRLPMLVLWGPRQLAVYNEAFYDLLGRPPGLSLGAPAAALALEPWAAFRPLIEQARSVGAACGREQVALRINRNGNRCETYVNVTCAPVPGVHEAERGVFVTCEDKTAAVHENRRLRTLALLATQLSPGVGPRGSKETGSIFAAAVEALAAEQGTVAFAALCEVDRAGGSARVLAKAGMHRMPPEFPVAASFSLMACGESLEAALRSPPSVDAPVLATQIFGGQENAYVQPLELSARGECLVLITGASQQAADAGHLLMLKVAASQLTSALGQARAIAEQRASRDEAEGLRQRIEALCEQAPTPITILRGSDFIVEVANPAACAAWQRGRQDVLNRPLLEILPELEGQEFLSTLRRVGQTGVTELAKETPLQLRRGMAGELQTVYFNFVYAPLHSCKGELEGIAVLAFEVTDEVLAHAEMDRLRNDAEAANRTKDEFLAMLGHELRNPLSPIVTSLQLLRMRGVEFRELNVMERQVSHLIRLVDDLLDIARITQGRVELRKEGLQVGSVIRRAVEMASPLLDRKAQQLDLRIAAGLGLVKGDLARLAQVVANLLTNASKFSERGTLITLTAGRVGEVMRLSVRDEGIGIPPHMLERVFDSFVQGRQAIDRAAGGLGLGLAIVRSLVSLHGGNVYALSEGTGKGAEFVVELPLQEMGAATPTGEFVTKATLSEDEAPPHTRILVVDDNDDAAAMLAEALSDVGYEVEVAHDGPSAMKAAKRFQPDVALLDIGLPVMDGYELAQRLRDSDRGLRLIAVTGYGQEEDRRRSREAGFAAHLVKPVNLDVLTKVMRVES